jgi:hypothetical protein
MMMMMDDVQKMALVPYDMMIGATTAAAESRDSARLGTLMRSPPLQKVLNVDRRMEETMNDRTMAEDEKARRYSQLLEELRLFKSKGQRRETQPVRIVADDDVAAAATTTTTTALENEILSSMPKTMVQKTHRLIDKLKRVPGLAWNEHTGAVSVDGKVLKDSNLVDLVHDAIRPRKKTPDPAGWRTFSDVLVRGGVPIEYINNPKRRDYILNRRHGPSIKRRQMSPESDDVDAGDPILQSPMIKTRRKKARETLRKNPINWDPLPPS